MRNDGAFDTPQHDSEAAIIERRKQAAEGLRAIRAKANDVSDATLKEWREDVRR
jgi:hypothetical protein